VNALRAEWTKARTLPSTFWLLLGLVALTVAIGAIATATVHVDQCATPASCHEDTVRLSLAGLWLSQAIAVVVGVLAFGNEYGTRMITTTVAAVPRRLRVMIGKATVVVGLVLVAAVVGVAGAVLAARLILPHNGFAVPDLLAGPALRATGGTVLYLGLVALLAVGVAAVVRDTAGALTAVLLLLYAAPALALVVDNVTWQHRLQKFSPMTAGMAVQATTNFDRLVIGPWAGLGVLALWTAAAVVAGTLFFLLRDA
jgi:ABC-2 type transport system permease protein